MILFDIHNLRKSNNHGTRFAQMGLFKRALFKESCKENLTFGSFFGIFYPLTPQALSKWLEIFRESTS